MSNFSRWQTSAAVLAVVAITASTAAPIVLSAPAFAQTTNFSDVSSDYWAKDFIAALATKGIIKGFPDGRFKPDSPVTRAEFGAMILKVNSFKRPKGGNQVAFVDVPQSHWAFSAIQEANKTGFLKGYPGNAFRPNQNIPRVEVLVSLANGLGYSGGSPTALQASYRDAARIPEFARNSVAAATEKRLVVNYPDINLINANRVATRAEVAASIYQALFSVGEVPALASNFIPGAGSSGGGTTSATGAGSSGGGTTSTALKANNDTAEVQSTTPVTIKVLDNDTAADTTKLTVASVDGGSNGKAEIAADKKSVTYTANAGFSGTTTDSFSYTVSDGKDTQTAKVNLSFKPAPASPPQAKDDTTTTSAGKPVTVTVLANDTASEVEKLVVTDVTDGSNGTVTIPAGKKSVTYTPKAGFTGPNDSFTYTISDGKGGTATANVAVSFKQAAAPQPKDDTATASSGQSVPIDVLKNDTAGEGTSLTVTQVTNPGNGTVAIAADKKSVTYTSKSGVTGVTDKFIYTVSNEAGVTATANVAVTLGAASPLSAKADAQTIPAGKPVTINVLGNDSAPAGASLTISAVTPASNGKVAIANAGKSVVYTPNPGFAGTSDSFSYTVSDGKGNTTTAPVTVTVELAALDAVDDPATVQQGKPVIIDVLSNDRAPAGSTLKLTIDKKPANGEAKVTTGNTITYTPKKGIAAGTTDSFSYTIDDGKGGKATANVTVTLTL